MALRATIFKADIHIADTDRGYFGSHSVTVARHPSETDERMMTRLLAFALFADADDTLVFTRGLSETDEPELWRHDLTGAIIDWIDVGLPDERRIMKACGRAQAVTVLAYGRQAEGWWKAAQPKLTRARGLRVLAFPPDDTMQLATLAERKMALNVNIQDDTVWVSSEAGEATLALLRWQ